jgi:CubicO group peptidase (beta-lactamase class C family)
MRSKVPIEAVGGPTVGPLSAPPQAAATDSKIARVKRFVTAELSKSTINLACLSFVRHIVRILTRRMRVPTRLATLALVTLAPVLAAQQPDDAAWSAYVRSMRQFVESRGVVGAATLVVNQGQVTRHEVFGHSDLARRLPITHESIFHYGSITKTLTAIAIMQLRDRGKLSLDDKVTRWVPELRQIHNPFGSMDDLTVRMLLTHASGLQNPTWPYGRGRPWEPFEPTRWEQLVSMMPYQALHFAPGSRWGYSNPAYIYLARIVESITGDPYQAYIYKNLWMPLGLSTSYFGDTPYHLASARSHNYTIVTDSASGKPKTVDNGVDFDPGITIPNGGWNAPLTDVAAYVVSLLGDGSAEAVVSRATLAEMWRPAVTQGMSSDGSAAMGLGFFLYRDGNAWLVGHTGQQAGFMSFMFFNPRTRTGVIAAINTIDERDAEGFGRAFADLGAQGRRLLRSPT